MGDRKRGVVRRVLLAVSVMGIVLVAASPDAPAGNEIHLTAAGDFGVGTPTASVLDKVMQLHPDANLALGDLSYSKVTPETAWCSYVKSHVGEGFPFELVAGNHESLDIPNGEINNFSSCLPNQTPGVVGTYGREYYVDMPKGAPLVRVIQTSPNLAFSDGKWAYAQGDAHYTWVANAIDDARAKGVKWVVVTAHEPCLTIGIQNCPTNKDLYQMLVAKKVDLVLHGHEHSYMRTHQLRSGTGGCPTIAIGSFNPACVADSDSAFVGGQGTVFATVGTGGETASSIDTGLPNAGYFAAWSGSNVNKTFGLLDLHLTDSQITAQFVPTSGGNFTDAFTITKAAPLPNLAPVAAMTTQTQNLGVTANGSSSLDPDGTIASWAWNFGDNTTATGATPAAHTYAAAGTYTITLTVTDNQGATNTTTKSVTVTDPGPASKLAEDTFTRTLASGWGSATLGGAWTVSTASAFSVNGSAGVITSPAGAGRSAFLRSVSTNSSEFRGTLSVDKIPAGTGEYVYLATRSIPNVGDYRTVLRFRPDGTVSVYLVRLASNGTYTSLTPDTLVNGVSTGNSNKVEVATQAAGTSPSTLRVKVWGAGTTEPGSWNLTASDSTANLQAAGSVGLATYLSSGATNAPIRLSLDAVVVNKP